jgi:hypothetical protein
MKQKNFSPKRKDAQFGKQLSLLKPLRLGALAGK